MADLFLLDGTTDKLLLDGTIDRLVLDGTSTSSVTPTLSSPTATATSGTVDTTGQDGELFCYVSTNATETDTTIAANGLVKNPAASGTQTFSFASLSLSPGTTYYAHYVHKFLGVYSSVSNSASFTTPHQLTITASVRTAQTVDGTGALTSSSVTPPSAGALIVVCVEINTTSGNSPASWPVTISDSTGGTWTTQKESYSGSGSGAAAGYAGIFTCPAGSTTARTITVTPNDTKAKSFKIYFVESTSGSVGVGTTGFGTWNGSQTFTAYTATQNNSKGLLSFIDRVPNTLSASTDTNTVADFLNQGSASFLSAYKADNATSGNAVQFQVTDGQSGSSTNIHWAALELYPSGSSPSVLSSSGLGALTGVGSALFASTVSSAGVGAVSPVGSSTFLAALSSSGLGQLSADSISGLSTFAISGLGALGGVGAALFSGAFSSSGIGTDSSVGAALASGVLSGVGTGALTGVGSSRSQGNLASVGVGAANPIGASQALATAIMAGVGAFTGVVNSLYTGNFTMLGLGTATPQGSALASGALSVSGTGVASWIKTIGSDMSLVGIATVQFSASSLYIATISALGSGVANFIGASFRAAWSQDVLETSAWDASVAEANTWNKDGIELSSYTLDIAVTSVITKDSRVGNTWTKNERES